jgi:uncharacterized membrane protein
MEIIFILGFMIISTWFGALGAFLIKKSLNRFTNIFSIFKNKLIYLSFILFGFGFLIYLFLLKASDVSYLFPITSLTYVWSTFLSIKFLHEKLNFRKVFGILLIIIGIIVMSLG